MNISCYLEKIKTIIIFSERICPISKPFMLTYADVRTVKFFPPAESGVPAVCKGRLIIKLTSSKLGKRVEHSITFCVNGITF